MVKITADEVLSKLLVKHSNDLCISECKDGPTQGVDNYSRMDLLVMNRSWSNMCFTGYEIKVSRNDFLRDDKWRSYLKMCNEFYFCTPWKMISVDEVPEVAGLRYIQPSGRVYTIKKAPFREQGVHVNTLLYILMCRVKVSDEWRNGFGEKRVDYYRRWLAEKAEKQDIGHRVSYKVGEIVRATQRENQNLKLENENLAELKQLAAEMDIPVSYGYKSLIKQRLEAKTKELIDGVDKNLERNLRDLQRVVGRLLKNINGDEKDK